MKPEREYRRPQQDRTAIWIAMSLTLVVFAALGGWFARDWFAGQSETGNRGSKVASANNSSQSSDVRNTNRSDGGLESAKSETRYTENDNHQSGKSEDIASELGKEQSTDTSQKSTNLNVDGSSDDSSSSPASKSGGIKLSDLPSYRTSKPAKRFQATGRSGRKKLTNSRSDSTKTDSTSSGEPLEFDRGKQVDRPRSPTREGSGPTAEGNQFAFPQSESEIVFYQELIVDRAPMFRISGLSDMKQQFQFRTVSQMRVQPADKNGFRKVSQKVVSAKLVKADSVSRDSLADSIKSLPGKTFTFTLDHRQRLIDFKGEKEKPKTTRLDGLDLSALSDLSSLTEMTGKGFAVSSVMDLDGWREMAQLTFLLPDGDKKKWKDQMAHDWGDLGSWSGETQFEKKAKTNGKLRIDYAHWMNFLPPKPGASKLPFKMDGVAFRSTEAGGRMLFDEKKRRIESLIERFNVSGSMQASMLGSSIKLEVSEVQTFNLKLHDQNPQ